MQGSNVRLLEMNQTLFRELPLPENPYKRLNKDGAPCRTRTCDLLVRSQTLYPTELRAREHTIIPAERCLRQFAGATLKESETKTRT
jgi:hypothetical protein